jgi:putative nucleotidyltransferase with HDIG domain
MKIVDEGKVALSMVEAIPKGVLSHFKPTPVNLYLCERGDECVLLCSKEYKIAEAKLDELRANKAPIFVKKDDYTTLKSYLKKAVVDISSNTKMGRDEKSQMVYSTAVMVIDDLFNNVESKEAVEDSKDLATVVLDNLLKDNATFLSMVGVLSYDYYTYSHCVNVCIYSIAIGKKLGLKGEEIEDLAHAAILHDIGKAHIDPKILNKEGALDDKEFEIMKTHTTEGVVILEKLNERNQNILDSVLSHHEKMDGTGYPHGLNRYKIPFFAQIIAVADIFDALTTKRSYKEALGSFAALRIMKDRMSIGLNEAALNALVQSFRP